MTSICRRVDGILVREVVGDILLLDTETGLIHQLNETASFIWRNCAEAVSVQAIAELLANTFDVEQDTALRDVTEAVRRMRELRLVVEA
jgi:hypothetical protein